MVGTYECKVDAKAGLLPACLKKQMTLSLQDGFVLKAFCFQPCLELSNGSMEFNDAKNQ
jgi:MraZ protein